MEMEHFIRPILIKCHKLNQFILMILIKCQYLNQGMNASCRRLSFLFLFDFSLLSCLCKFLFWFDCFLSNILTSPSILSLSLPGFHTPAGYGYDEVHYEQCLYVFQHINFYCHSLSCADKLAYSLTVHFWCCGFQTSGIDEGYWHGTRRSLLWENLLSL